MDELRVSVRPSEPARLIEVKDHPNAPDEWSFEDLHVSPAHAAALAYRDKRRAVGLLPPIDAADLIRS